MKIYYDERGVYITEQELYNQYILLKENNETDSQTFEEYIKNCTDKNGTLKRV